MVAVDMTSNVPAPAIRMTIKEFVVDQCDLSELPQDPADIVQLPEMSFESFIDALRSKEIQGIAMIQCVEDLDLLTASTADPDVTPESKATSSYEQTWKDLQNNPDNDLIKEFEDVFPEEVPAMLLKDKGVRHVIDLVPGTKYCVNRRWPVPRWPCAGEHDSALQPDILREDTNQRLADRARVQQAERGTIPAETPIPRKDVIIPGMAGSTIFSTIDLRDGFYQILMRIKDIPKTAVSAPSGMLWEWLVMPQGLSNAPATFNRMVTEKLRPPVARFYPLVLR
ncbi:Aste57867_20725 [Aphanomyces stellatus]|uniref:Aste57867_20725 protein n=1 Tax=Aphanomyces stellatus TaxID=120398 RepID=A0A485LG98_9STRA|nr:hypothetical protein As57867_020657 [Aphanomyces stellatus]VFT97405.1 Aste57867_20725 [Aphanomyces stellatus]